MKKSALYYRLKHEEAQMYPQSTPRQRNITPKARRPDPIQDESKILPYFDGVKQTLIINLEEHHSGRFHSMMSRMGPWAVHARRFPGTDGRGAALRAYWASRGILQNALLNNGQCGCYDSHMRAWQEIARSDRTTLVLEDDADLAYSADLLQHVNAALRDVSTLDPNWDLLYIGYDQAAKVRRVDRQSVGLMPNKEPFWMGGWAYILRPEGAQRLVLGATPVRDAVDAYMSKAARRGLIHAYAACPLRILVVDATSLTRSPS